MDQAGALAFLESMFTNVAEASAQFDIALTRATVADPMGRAPLDPDWVPTYDEWIAAAEVAELLALHGGITPAQVVESFTSEGATFKFAPTGQSPDWQTVAAALRARSVRTASHGMGVIDLGDHPVEFMPRSGLDGSWW